MYIAIQDQPLDPWIHVAEYQQQHLDAGSFGATTLFVGSMRDFNEGDQVQQMTLEHYPGMTEKYLEKIATDAIHQWDILDVLIVHRVGEIHPNDVIVVVAVWSAHRAAAYEANQQIMEKLKSEAPFWKKETLTDERQRWVEGGDSHG